jgi:hypothetical protein
VSDADKKKIWDKLVTRFIFPQGLDKLMKEYAMKHWTIMFRNWKSEMNTKWAKKGLDPTKRYKIMGGQWAVFLEQRRDLEFVAQSEANTKLAKKNKYHHHLGTDGYQCQVPKWRQEEAAKKVAGLPTLSEQLGERTANWIHARKPRCVF